MRRIKVIFLVLIIFLNCILSMGCWNYREIDRLSIVAAVAVDKGKGDTYEITVELVDFGGEKNDEPLSKTVTIEGRTIFEAARNAIAIEGKRLYWSHSKVVIISREVAEEGVIRIIDWFNRDAETREDVNILIARIEPAKSFLQGGHKINKVIGFELRDMIQNEKSLAKAPQIQIWRFANDLIAEGVVAIAPVVEMKTVNGGKAANIMGTAIFKKDKLIGFIGSEDTKDMLFVRNEIKGGILVQIETQDNVEIPIALEIFKSKTKVETMLSYDEIRVKIKIETTVAIGEVGGTVDYIEETKRKELESTVEKALEGRIKRIVKKMQFQYEADVFGFGSKIRMSKPKEWKKIKDDWENKFKSVKVDVSAKIHIKNSATLSKPIEAGD